MPSSVLNGVFAEIEGVDFAAETNLCNDIHWVRYLVRTLPATSKLTQYALADVNHAEELVKEVTYLLGTETDATKLHRYDAAVAAYLFVLYDSNTAKLREAMRAVQASELPNLWWAHRAYNYLIRFLPSEDTTFDDLGSVHDSDPPSFQILREDKMPVSDDRAYVPFMGRV